MSWTVILTNWARPDNTRMIIKSFRETCPRARLVLIDNSGKGHLNYLVDEAITSTVNYSVATRWFCAMQARTEYVLIQDDDLLITEKDFLPTLEKELRAHAAVGLFGARWDENLNYVPTALANPTILKGRFIATKAKHLTDLVVPRYDAEDDIFVSHHLAKKGTLGLVDLVLDELPAPRALSDRPDHFERRNRTINQLIKP